jgi:hypothetical protein
MQSDYYPGYLNVCSKLFSGILFTGILTSKTPKKALVGHFATIRTLTEDRLILHTLDLF